MRREIGLFAITSWGVGIILGAGIYVLVGEAASIAGNSLDFLYIRSYGCGFDGFKLR